MQITRFNAVKTCQAQVPTEVGIYTLYLLHEHAKHGR